MHALFVDCGVQPDRASCFTKMRRYTLASFRTEFTILCLIATVLEGLLENATPAALGQQLPEVTKQPLVYGWRATPE